jgi:cytochrome c oxidase subunit 2
MRKTMTVRRIRALLARAAALAAVAILGAGCQWTRAQYPQTSLSPTSDYARAIDVILQQQVFWVVVIFVLVQTLVIVAVVRFRARPGAPEPRPVHGNTVFEIAWTIAPAIVLALVAVPTVKTIYHTQAPAPKGALLVKAIGHQWWWEFQYPDLGVTTGSEMHVPVGTAVNVQITSVDVIHSFWFPAIGGKRDAVPSHTNAMWFTPDSLGVYTGQCAELCGVSHANMRMKLFVDTQADFKAWVAHQKQLPPEPDSVANAEAFKGKQVFMGQACVGCHSIEGVSAGVIGPNLTHVATRTAIAGAIFDNNAENLGKWISNPPGRKPGALMPNLGLSDEQVKALVAYLQTLK